MQQHCTAPPGNAERRHLIEALLDFEALPGRYPLALREPRALFDRSHQVLMLAAGRSVEGLALEPADAPRVQRAACFFVRMAMLRPGADHYTLLGLPPDFHEEALRDHYRLLMRLTHPDFAGGANAWPGDAATRINQANDVLSSRVQRTQYDRQLASAAPRRIAVNSLAAVLPRASRQHRPAVWGWGLAAGGLGALVLTLMQWPGSSADSELAQATRTAPAVSHRAPEPAQTLLLQPTLQVADKLVAPAPDAAPAQTGEVARVKLAQAAQDEQIAQPVQIAKEKPERRVQAAQAVQTTKEIAVQAVPAEQIAQAEPPAKAEAMVAVALVMPPVSQPARIPNLADAQLAMSQLIQAMQAGRGEELVRGLERSVRQSEGATGLVDAYNVLVGDSRAVRLGPVRLRGHPDADQLVVDGMVQLVLNDQGPPPPVRELRFRALFAQRGGQVVMTDISTGGARP